MTVFADDFNRADSTTSIGPGWSLGYGAAGVSKIGIASNQVAQVAGLTHSGDMVARRTGGTFTGDQFAEIALKALPTEANTWVPGPSLKASDSGFSQYGVSYKLDGSVVVRKSGTAVITTSTTLTVNDVFRLEWIASTSTLTLKKNGAALGAPYVDGSPLTGNNIGLYSYALVATETAWRLDDFQGGDLVASDTTEPTLTSPTGAATGSTTASGSVSTDEGNGTLFAVCTTSATPPSAAQVQAGQDNASAAAAYATSQAVSGAGTQNVNATGLVAETTYYWHFQHQDAAANDSTVSTSSSFTTEATPAPGGGAVILNFFGF